MKTFPLMTLAVGTIVGGCAGFAATKSLGGSPLAADYRVRESREQEVRSLISSARAQPVEACDEVLPKALAGERFADGTGEGRRPYSERDALEHVRSWACQCKTLLVAASEVESLRMEDLVNAPPTRLAAVLNSFNQRNDVQAEALRLLKQRVQSAELTELSSWSVEKKRVDCWERPGSNDLTFWTVVSFHDDGLYDIVQNRRAQLAEVERQRQARERDAARRNEESAELARKRQSPEYWAAEVRDREDDPRHESRLGTRRERLRDAGA